jgi:hypothetical protein
MVDEVGFLQNRVQHASPKPGHGGIKKSAGGEMILRFDLKPAQRLQEAEQKAGNKLAEAERADDVRKVDVSAGTRQPPGKNERPYLILGRGRSPAHAANNAALGILITETTRLQELFFKLTQDLEKLDGEADELELRHWNAWLSVKDPALHGFLLFYRNAARSDYGNPSYELNRNWWDNAKKVFRPEDDTPRPELPKPIADFEEEIVAMADRYGPLLDQVTTTRQTLPEKWQELVVLGAQVRKDRRSSRALLREDFNSNMKWVNELVPPLREKKKKDPPGGGGGGGEGSDG